MNGNRSPGSRVGALITTVVLAVVLISGSGWLLAAQALVFATGAVFGLRRSPYGLLYGQLIRPRLGPPRELEPEAPPRFAQAVGLVFAIAGVAGYAAGVTWLGLAATAVALVAAFLNMERWIAEADVAREGECVVEVGAGSGRVSE